MNTVLAFKMVYLSDSGCPEVSEFKVVAHPDRLLLLTDLKEARVVAVKGDKVLPTLCLWLTELTTFSWVCFL